MPEPRFTRSQILALGSAGIAGNILHATAAQAAAVPTVDTGSVSGSTVAFPRWTAESEPAESQPPKDLPRDERVGFAVVGLGRLALEEILPAFAQSERARVVALVSGDSDKARIVGAQYGIAQSSIYDYSQIETLRDNPQIQAVYIVLPNALHREYVLRTAAAGKHVLCEKPMATDSRECEEMIAACRRANRLLMIAYRCQYDLVNRDLIAMVRSKKYGRLKVIEASNMQDMAAPDQWRLKKAMAGGGSLFDIGIYCLNSSRVLTGEEPTEIFARMHTPPGDPRFTQVEETINFMLRFPSGVQANCTASYGAHQARTLSVRTETASFTLENAFAYRGLRLRAAHRDGEVETDAVRQIEPKNQFSLELDHFADCITTGRTPRTPGEEGLQDHRIMEAIYRSAASGQLVSMPPAMRLDATRGPALV